MIKMNFNNFIHLVLMLKIRIRIFSLTHTHMYRNMAVFLTVPKVMVRI